MCIRRWVCIYSGGKCTSIAYLHLRAGATDNNSELRANCDHRRYTMNCFGPSMSLIKCLLPWSSLCGLECDALEELTKAPKCPI